MLDCNSFLRRKNWAQKDLAERLNVATSTVGMWCTGKSTPAYAVIVELLKLGMTIEELFGKEIADMVLKNSGNDIMEKGYDSPEFRKGVEETIADMKARGLI